MFSDKNNLNIVSASNKLGTQGGVKNFLSRAQIF